SRQHSESRRLAAAGRPQQHDEFTVVNCKVQLIHDGRPVECLCDLLEPDIHNQSVSQLQPLPHRPLDCLKLSIIELSKPSNVLRVRDGYYVLGVKHPSTQEVRFQWHLKPGAAR